MRQHAPHIGADTGRAKGSEHTDTLIALLHVKLPHILIAQNGVLDALITHMMDAQFHPFHGKFALQWQQRQKRRTEGADSAGRLGAHDLIDGNLNQAHFLVGFLQVGRQDLIQNSRIRIFSGSKELLNLFLSRTQSTGIFFFCFQAVHFLPSPGWIFFYHTA